MGEVFYLDFKSDNFGRVIIDEPIGFSSVDFNLNQKDGGFARDISFNGGESPFEFVNFRNHYLDQLLYYYHFFGFESKVNLIIEKAGVSNIIGELDFAKAESDDLEYFKCKVIQQSAFQIIKRRKDVKVDLLSSVTIDGEYIAPLIPKKTLLISKPVLQDSAWEQSTDFSEEFTAITTSYLQLNPCQNLIISNLEDSASWFEAKARSSENPSESDFLLLTARNNLKNINIDLKGININFSTSTSGLGNGYTDFSFQIRYGTRFDTAERINLLSSFKRENESYSFAGDFIQTLPSLNRGDSIWILFGFKIRQSAIPSPFNPKFNVDISIVGMKTTISAESSSYSSITPSFRLIDVMAQVIKSISGLDISAPRFNVSGEFYDNMLFNGNFLRRITNDPFYISLEDIEKSITEINGDYEIASDGTVFFGIEEDFYTPLESGFFDKTQFSELNKTFNEKHSINKFAYKYRDFQALKERDEPNTADNIHGDSEWVLANKRVENKKEVEVKWIRDAFLIESNRRKGIEISDNTSSQDDDKIFCIDVVDTTSSRFFNEVTTLNHVYDEGVDQLSLIGDGKLDFIAIGLSSGSIFEILSSDKNIGVYNVVSVEANLIKLTKTSAGAIGSGNNGIRNTNYRYEINQEVAAFTMRTDEGFTSFDNLKSPNTYANLRYSVKRNILNYYNSYLATCNLYRKEIDISNSFYKNNGKCSTTYLNDTVIEDKGFKPSNPILSPFIYDGIVFANVEFEEFISLQNNIRTNRGYIRSIDKNNNVIKLYAVDMSYENLSKQLTIKGEEKYEPSSMTISNQDRIITINNETKVLNLSYEIVSEKLYIFDDVRQRLYNGVFWDLVSINGVYAESVSQLEKWLDLLRTNPLNLGIVNNFKSRVLLDGGTFEARQYLDETIAKLMN
jgi:hypothetical protein